MSRTKRAARRGGGVNRGRPGRASGQPSQPNNKRRKLNNGGGGTSVGVAEGARDMNVNGRANPFTLISSDDESKTNMIPKQQLGENRLRSGFGPRKPKSRVIQRSASHEGTPEDSDEDDPNSDLEMPDSEPDGGMTLNVQPDSTSVAPILISSSEEGEVSEDDDEEEEYDPEHGDEDRNAAAQTNQANTRDVPPQVNSSSDHEMTFVIDSKPTTIKLSDLNPDQLDDQLRYAFWDMDRDQIDLGRFAKCLSCHGEGHIDESCPTRTCTHCGQYAKHQSARCPGVKKCGRCRLPGHDSDSCDGIKSTTVPCDLCSTHGHVEDDCPSRFYPVRAPDPNHKVQLWISCCVCASKNHLVGDCPEVLPARAPRWSLKAYQPNQITNLSLTTGTKKQEKEAENRGIRPPGLSIKGRAARMQANAIKLDPRDTSDDEIDFFSHPPAPRGRDNNSNQNYPSRPSRHPDTRYDRYEANYTSDPHLPHRPPNKFYNTDSFGRPRRGREQRAPSPRRRSSSPPPRRRSPSPRRHDPNPHNIDRYQPPAHSNPRDMGYQSYQPPVDTDRYQPPPRTGPSGFVPVNLPTRKSSNTTAPAKTEAKNEHEQKALA